MELNAWEKMVQNRIDRNREGGYIRTGILSDGYHTFDELYFHRMKLFSIICKQNKEKAWRSKLHDDGTMYENYFIVGVSTGDGDYSYHYHMEHWEHFKGVKELDKAPKWDGHKPEDIGRLDSLVGKQEPQKPIEHTKLPNDRFTYLCPTCNRLYWDKEFLSDYCSSCGQKFDLD